MGYDVLSLWDSVARFICLFFLEMIKWFSLGLLNWNGREMFNWRWDMKFYELFYVKGRHEQISLDDSLVN